MSGNLGVQEKEQKISLEIGFRSGNKIKVQVTSYEIALNSMAGFKFTGMEPVFSINLEHVEYVREV